MKAKKIKPENRSLEKYISNEEVKLPEYKRKRRYIL